MVVEFKVKKNRSVLLHSIILERLPAGPFCFALTASHVNPTGSGSLNVSVSLDMTGSVNVIGSFDVTISLTVVVIEGQTFAGVGEALLLTFDQNRHLRLGF
jgi:hypothetical protein